ncbi:glutaredoxin family protein [Halalkalicoccus jeotgali]|uniref:Glutaredoxin 2 n=1 Tax=Halalkalicoccus jeotgali (strain DSM 18796 / CECT 7217 / JCM 14584 / KCTC 4019 / B3) TaxID=795797 RepID=D8J2H6_HALJB|nr:glutaredoxin family protein [Halalkalicoccus jeotgali]ADJ14933.1 glutaredoxin 2 [Halalkalicoccus jeotgali B3]
MSEPTVITVYTRENCHLCSEAIRTIEDVASGVDRSVEIESIDVDEAGLAEEYGERVPYVLVDDRPAFKYRVDPDELRAELLP